MTDIKIFQPCKTALSSGKAKTKKWCIEFDQSCGNYRENLMGWNATKDNRYQIKLEFSTLEKAIAFAEKHHLTYEIEHPHLSLLKPKNYGDNFKISQVKG